MKNQLTFRNCHIKGSPIERSCIGMDENEIITGSALTMDVLVRVLFTYVVGVFDRPA